MTQESGESKNITREDLLAKLKADGINTLEDLVEQAIPEVGGFLLQSGGIRSIGSATTSDTDFKILFGDWNTYIE